MKTNSILTLKNVSVLFGTVRALDNVNLEVYEGEWLALTGPSGSGKTTMINLIGCLAVPTSGSVILDGEEIGKASGRQLTALRRDKIGLIFQQFHLIPHLTALENVMAAQYYHSLVDKEEAQEALSRVGLSERVDHLPYALSGGEKQRVCIARALINCPKIILADEPTGNLDEDNEKMVLNIFRQLHKDGNTIIVVTHDDEVATQADRIVRLEHGKVK